MKKSLLSAHITSVLVFGSILALNTSAFALSLTIENKSEWEVHELYFAPANETTWGEDQLGDDVIETGASFTLTKIAKDDYDVKIVDEDGDSCILEDVDFRVSEVFVLTDKILLGCQKNTEQDETEE